MWTKRSHEGPGRKATIQAQYSDSEDEDFPTNCLPPQVMQCASKSSAPGDCCAACAAPLSWYRRKRNCELCKLLYCGACCEQQDIVDSHGHPQKAFVCDPCITSRAARPGRMEDSASKPAQLHGIHSHKPMQAFAALDPARTGMVSMEVLQEAMLAGPSAADIDPAAMRLEALADVDGKISYPSLIAQMGEMMGNSRRTAEPWGDIGCRRRRIYDEDDDDDVCSSDAPRRTMPDRDRPSWARVSCDERGGSRRSLPAEEGPSSPTMDGWHCRNNELPQSDDINGHCHTNI